MLKPQENKQTKNIIKKILGCQMDKRETNSDYEMEKKMICKYSLFKNIKETTIPWDCFCQED